MTQLTSRLTNFYRLRLRDTESLQHKACSHHQIPRSLDHILSYNKQKAVAETYLYKPQLSSAAISKKPIHNPKVTTRCAYNSLITFSLSLTHKTPERMGHYEGLHRLSTKKSGEGNTDPKEQLKP